jgi:hypothetical protein
MNITKEMIEVGARAYDPDLWNTATKERRDVLRWRARACLAGALAAAEPHNVVLAVVPDEMPQQVPAGPVTPGVTNGFNACRAAFLAGKVVI